VEQLHHRPIRKFNFGGLISDEAFVPRLKTEYVRLLISEMKLNGYAQRLDIDIDFTIQFNSKKQHFEFEITVYGIYVGKKKAQWITGIDGTKVIYTQPNKLKESLAVQA
jgi:hypothetical protein